MAFLRANDTISGQEGRAYMTIDDITEEMFYIKTLEASIEKQKAEIKTLGRRGVQYKATGWSGSGTMTIYYLTTKFRQLMLDYVKSGRDAYFAVKIFNDDPGSSVGQQTVTLHRVNLGKLIIAKLDTESEALDEEIEFTFEDFDIDESFNAPVLG